MKILFLTENEISPLQGGTEHVTHTLSRALMARGIECHLACCIPCTAGEPSAFDGKLVFDRDLAPLEGYLRAQRFDSVICNLVKIEYKKRILPVLRRVCDTLGTKIIVCYHAMPGEELTGSSVRNCIWRTAHGIRPAESLKLLGISLCPQAVLKAVFRPRIRKRYRLLYDNADALVLLSEKFYGDFASLAGLEPDAKFHAIGNALSFEQNCYEPEAKEKTVMMLSRMDEKSKRISAALRIWKRVQPSHPDWKLVIVGGGDDLPWFRRLARGLQGVSFEGRQPDSLPYYRGASIFMLTSRYEGWGITLTEAQQCGAVPVAFASYASASDIIESGANGLLVKDRDEKAFAQALETLMDDDKLRSSMALRGLDSVQAFRGKAVVSRWMELLEKTSAAK